MASIWCTEPVALASGDFALEGIVQDSSFRHEQGHNVTLHNHEGCCSGGKIDGTANAIFSETMTRIVGRACDAYVVGGLPFASRTTREHPTREHPTTRPSAPS